MITLLWDIGKCALAMRIGRGLAGDVGVAVSGLACMLGHSFPCLHRFRGGKGVAVGAAIAYAVSPKAFLLIIAVFLLLTGLSRRVTLGSVCASLSLTVYSVIHFADSPARGVLGIAAGLFVAFMHRDNIRRLIKGEEPAFKAAEDY